MFPKMCMCKIREIMMFEKCRFLNFCIFCKNSSKIHHFGKSWFDAELNSTSNDTIFRKKIDLEWFRFFAATFFTFSNVSSSYTIVTKNNLLRFFAVPGKKLRNLWVKRLIVDY